MCTLTHACTQLHRDIKHKGLQGSVVHANGATIHFSVLFVYTSYDSFGNVSNVGDEELFSRLIPAGVLF